MTFDIITIFSDFFSSMLEHGMLKRALTGGQIEVRVHDLRDYTEDRHRTVDDRPYGGGPGMVFKPEPLFHAVETLKGESAVERFPVILLSPQGRLLRQAVVEELAKEARLVLICGRYEGVDERVASYLATDELSVGDYILSGGELAAAVVMETVARLLPGVLGNEESRQQDSFAGSIVTPGGASLCVHKRGQHGLLDFPQYTRPADFRGLHVPEVLLSGDHEGIQQWRRREALIRTWKKRPELLLNVPLDEADREVIERLERLAADPVRA